MRELALYKNCIIIIMCVDCTVKGEGDEDAAARTLRVMERLRKYNDPLLWTYVSSLVLSSDGVLNLVCVVQTTEEMDTLEWFMMSSAGKDIRGLK